MKNIKANAKIFSIPVIALTAVRDEQTRTSVEKLGVSAYLMKPVNTDELLEKIKEVLVKE